MLMKSMVLHNFRSYHGDVSIEFGKLTAFVGKNDIGKSTILEALDVFFNDSKGVVKIDKPDINIVAAAEGDNEISISICFEDLPDRVVIDATNETTLQAEYLLNGRGQLEIVKRYPNAGNTKVFIRANHPVNQHCSDLLNKKDTELKRILDDQEIECNDRTRNAVMRESIRNHYRANLQLNIIDIDVSKNDAKSVWERLQTYLPIYSLFQADRKNCDGDSEVQDPLKEAVKSIIADETISELLERVSRTVSEKLQEVSDRTLLKIREMSPEIANTLSPSIPPAASLKWADVFKNVSIAGDENIPINKRGSGVKRLILFNFFRAEAERKLLERENSSIIYAIEEPETSQHVANQRLLVRAFKTLSELQNTQILITTHIQDIMNEILLLKAPARLIDAHSFAWIVREDEFVNWMPSYQENNRIERSTEISIQKIVEYSTNKMKTTVEVFERNAEVVRMTKALADGHCQLCNNPSPFKDRNGIPYLEVHHVIWLAHGGKDNLSNTVALCPNCHTKMHILDDPADVQILAGKLLNAGD